MRAYAFGTPWIPSGRLPPPRSGTYLANELQALGNYGVTDAEARIFRPSLPRLLGEYYISAQLDGLAATALAKQGVPGMSLTVARDGVVLYAKGFGLRDVAAKRPVDANTIFSIGSVTKQFTAAAIELLVRGGKLSLDAPVASYLPDAPHATITAKVRAEYAAWSQDTLDFSHYDETMRKALTPTSRERRWSAAESSGRTDRLRLQG